MAMTFFLGPIAFVSLCVFVGFWYALAAIVAAVIAARITTRSMIKAARDVAAADKDAHVIGGCSRDESSGFGTTLQTRRNQIGAWEWPLIDSANLHLLTVPSRRSMASQARWYYHCQRQRRAVNVSKKKLEGLFADELALLQPTPVTCGSGRIGWQQLTSEAKERAGESERRAKAIQQKLDPQAGPPPARSYRLRRSRRLEGFAATRLE